MEQNHDQDYETPSSANSSKGSSGKTLKIVVFLMLLAIVGLGIGIGVLFKLLIDAQGEIEEFKDPGSYVQKQEEEAKQVVDALRETIALPDDEEPSVATIIDVDALREQNPTFYEKAQNGDRLIVFSTVAVIYRYEQDYVVSVAPVVETPEDTVDDSGDTSTEERSLSIVVKNGTETNDIESEVVDKVRDLGVAGYTVTPGGSTGDTKYTKTTVYDLTDGAKADEVNKLAESLGFAYEDGAPEDESADEGVEALIIVGSDQVE